MYQEGCQREKYVPIIRFNKIYMAPAVEIS